MKKYKVFVDSNGEDSLWFHAGKKVENPLTNLTPQYREQDKKKSCDEVNGHLLAPVFGIEGMVKDIRCEISSSREFKVVIEEYLHEEHQYKTHTIYISRDAVVTRDVPAVRQVPPQLREDGGYNY